LPVRRRNEEKVPRSEEQPRAVRPVGPRKLRDAKRDSIILTRSERDQGRAKLLFAISKGNVGGRVYNTGWEYETGILAEEDGDATT
jgi:hypothetical protein